MKVNQLAQDEQEANEEHEYMINKTLIFLNYADGMFDGSEDLRTQLNEVVKYWKGQL